MDAAEADSDVKLYKASSELLLEIQAKIPRLVLRSIEQQTCRKWVVASKVSEVTRLLDSFQEWPQLLDPYLASLVQVLVDTYLTYCVSHASEYVRKHDLGALVWPLPRAVAYVLYVLCKVRGHKVIVRLLNNEPKYVEPLLYCFRLWTAHDSKAYGMTWEERYIHLLWLSHLMLAPFELSTISGLRSDSIGDPRFTQLLVELPDVAINLTLIGLGHIDTPSKAREAANALLVRLCLRSDMQRQGLIERMVTWATYELQSPSDQTSSMVYRHIGLLELLFGIINSAADSEAAPYLSKVFETAYSAAALPDSRYELIRNSAPARKLLVKVMRTTVVHAVNVSNAEPSSNSGFDLNAMLEDCIQTLLDFLADKDTPVRQAASKALSIVCLKLESAMSAEIVEAVVDSLDENMLLEDVKDGKLFPITDVVKSESARYKKNLNAVDPLKWHGCMLTLGHLLFRRSLPTLQLPAVIDALIMGLNFEQRSNVGTSVGVSVRDAACFGIWSLARKYSTSELNWSQPTVNLMPDNDMRSHGLASNTIQVIATHLAISASLDPSGNLRRGSSAALQELIGRHPDAVAEGIPIVQTIDYHAVARRSRAMTKVTIAAAKLDRHYHNALLYALVGWRGARATDVDSRQQAAQAIGTLMETTLKADTLTFSRELVSQIGNLKIANTGSNAGARHGLLCALAAVMQTSSSNKKQEENFEVFSILRPVLDDMPSVMGAVEGRITVDLENILEGTSRMVLASIEFLSSFSKHAIDTDLSVYLRQWASSMLPILDRCTVSSDRTVVTDTAARANVAVIDVLDEEPKYTLLSCWLDQRQQSKADFTCNGRIATLAKVTKLVHSTSNVAHFEDRIVQYLSIIIQSSHPIEIKVNAMLGIRTILLEIPDLDIKSLESIVNAIHIGLADYTMDQRGDIGSLLRLEAIEAARHLNSLNIGPRKRQLTEQLLAKLAAEKLIKVRFQAWKCLEEFLKTDGKSARSFNHQADVSSPEYFRNLLSLYHLNESDQLLIGFMASMTGGTEEVSRACGEALISLLQDQKTVASEEPLVTLMTTSATQRLVRIADAEDREVTPVIEFLAFLVEHVYASHSDINDRTSVNQIWDACQLAHTASSKLVRLEAMVKLYSALTKLESYRKPALDKLTRLLLHRWPKIRGLAADAIYLHTSVQSFVPCDWNASGMNNKAAVVTLRKELRIAGITTNVNAQTAASAG